MEKLTRREALRRILRASAIIAAGAAGAAQVGCFPTAGGGSSGTSYYSNSGSYYSNSSSYDNYAHRYVVGGPGTGLGYTHYGDGHER